MDQAFAAPASSSAGSGCHDQRSFPVRASNARTSPLGMVVRLLSMIADPMMTRPPRTAGGDVVSYSSFPFGGRRSPWRKSIIPLSPKSPHTLPVRASRAKSRASMGETKMRRPQGRPDPRCESSHSRNHGRGGGLSMTSGHGDSVFEAHELRQHFRPGDHGDLPLLGFYAFDIVGAHCRGNDHDVRIRYVLRRVADEDLPPQLLKPLH